VEDTEEVVEDTEAVEDIGGLDTADTVAVVDIEADTVAGMLGVVVGTEAVVGIPDCRQSQTSRRHCSYDVHDDDDDHDRDDRRP